MFLDSSSPVLWFPAGPPPVFYSIFHSFLLPIGFCNKHAEQRKAHLTKTNRKWNETVACTISEAKSHLQIFIFLLLYKQLFPKKERKKRLLHSSTPHSVRSYISVLLFLRFLVNLNFPEEAQKERRLNIQVLAVSLCVNKVWLSLVSALLLWCYGCVLIICLGLRVLGHWTLLVRWLFFVEFERDSLLRVLFCIALMAEDSVNSPVTPERTKSNGNNSLRRNSTGKTSSSNTGESILPHYLRASTGSCHDFCKYGRQHAFEEKERRSMLKRFVKKSHESRNPAVSVALPRRKETVLVVKLKPSHESESYMSDTPSIVKHKASKQSPDSQNPAERDVHVERKKKSEVEFKSSPYSKTPSHESESYSFDTPQAIKREVSKQSPDSQNQAETKLLVERKKRSGVKFKYSPSSKTHISHTPQTKKQEVSSTEKVKVFSRKGSAKAKDLTLSIKHATSLRPHSLTVKPSSLSNSTGGKSGLRNSDVKTGKLTGAFRVAAKKALAPPPASLSSKSSVNKVANVNERKHRDLKILSPYTNNKIRKAEPKQYDEVQEKTLYVIKMETENKPLESDQNESHAIELLPAAASLPLKFSPLSNAQSSSSHEEDCQEESGDEGDCQEESEYTSSEAEDELPSESNEIEHIEEADSVEEGYNGRPRKAGVICSEDKNGQALKLKFRRGKVVDSQSLTNSPRRLKFKRGKVLGESQNVKAIVRRRSFKRTEVDSDTYGTEPDPQKVVLRHQDMQGKRDAQGLFNNVIEETASKLAETRKSKVKALVGAFETVISLQEKKPSANTVT